MGMDQSVAFAGKPLPSWPAVRELLARHGIAVQMRMIDGELAFPDEEPPEAWRELRVAAPQGMVTIRREADGVRLVTWGNADAAMQKAWNALTWAYAAAGGGKVQTAETTRDAEAFRAEAELPEGLRPD